MELIALFRAAFPKLTGRYDANIRRSQLRRLYDAATPSNLRPSRGSVHSGNSTMDVTQDSLRKLCRYLDENHDLATGILDDLINNIVGTGLKPTPMVKNQDGSLADDVNKEISERYDEWSEKPDVTRSYSLTEFWRLIARTWLRDGEGFIHFIRTNNFNYRTSTRLALEGLEPDFCPFTLTEPENGILHGIKLNKWRAPAAYYFYDSHPGDFHLTNKQMFGKTTAYNADRVIHLRFVRRLNQLRGVPIMHSTLSRIRDIHDYEESERIAAKMAAELTGYIKRTGEFKGDIDDTDRVLEMKSGAFFELMVGEDVGTIKSERPNTALQDFRNAMMRATASGTMTRFSSIANDYNGTYSAQRQELVEKSIGYRALFNALEMNAARPVYREFLDATPITYPRSVDLRTVGRVDFRPPALPWIDPEKEASAWAQLIEARLESRSEIIRQRGRDPQKVREELERESQDEIFNPAPVMQPMQQDNEQDEDNQTEAA